MSNKNVPKMDNLCLLIQKQQQKLLVQLIQNKKIFLETET